MQRHLLAFYKAAKYRDNAPLKNAIIQWLLQLGLMLLLIEALIILIFLLFISLSIRPGLNVAFYMRRIELPN